MTRRKQNPFEGLIETSSKVPWWVGVAAAVAVYVWLHGVAGSDMTAVAPPRQTVDLAGQDIFVTVAMVGQYLFPFVFVVGAVLSAYGKYKHRKLHQQLARNPDRSVLNDMSRRQFEIQVGEAFRRKGYTVTETSGDGPDGSYDLAMKKTGETFLVQCKQWRAIKVGGNSLRELHGTMVAKGATGGFVVTSGVFTDGARKFAAGHHIELMDGTVLHTMIRKVRTPGWVVPSPLSVMTTGAPFCPECQSRMVMRKASGGKHAGKAYWNCSRYPDCTGKRKV